MITKVKDMCKCLYVGFYFSKGWAIKHPIRFVQMAAMVYRSGKREKEV